MEEEKAAAYYDELTRKGEGAAKFKQGLGFSPSTSNCAGPARGSGLPSSSSFFSNFVRASSPSKSSALEKEAQLESIQNKLRKKPDPSSGVPRDRSRYRDRDSRRRSRSRDHRHSRHRSASRERERGRSVERDRERDSGRERRRRSRSVSDEDRGRRSGRRRRSSSPRDRRSEKRRGGGGSDRGIDYAKLIEGYDKMSPAERVKAKMKLQLSETAERDASEGKGSGWERFDFDKDAPLDDEEIEATEDDAELVKHIGKSFRFSAVEARREEKINAAHEEAIFGASSCPPSVDTDCEVERVNYQKPNTESTPVTSLISEQVMSMQQGSWRDRARKV